MRLAELDYPLPEALIAQVPAPERAAARLLVLERGGGPLRHARIGDLPAFLHAGDVLVLNDTRVIPARVYGRRPSGGRLELLFVAPLGEHGEWEVLVRGVPRRGERVHLPGGQGEWVAPLGDGRWRLRLALREPALAWLERVGEVPLPPYVRRAPTVADRERYQTVYARAPGAVAAPTAGLHLTRELLGAIAAAGVRVATLTLHVGPGTFLPVRSNDLEQHVMAPEPSDIPPPTVEAIGAARPTHHRARGGGYPRVHARRHPRGGEGRGARAARRARGDHPPRQRLSPGAAARGRDGAGAGRAARAHGMGRAAAQRQRRLPGDEPRRAGARRRRRAAVPLARGRACGAPRSRGRRRHAGGARRRHRHVARRVRPGGRTARAGGARRRAHERVGRARPRRAHAGGDRALRDRAGRARPGAAGGERAGAHQARLRRLRGGRPLGRRAAGGDGPHRGRHGGAPPGRAAPLPDGRRHAARFASLRGDGI